MSFDSAAVRQLGSRLELFVDHYLIESLQGTRLHLHEPRDMGPAVKFDRPWEGLFSGVITVLQDGPLFRMYYRGLSVLQKGDGTNAECTCYAQSTDGIHWEKPELGLFEMYGTKKTNIVMHDQAPSSHNFCPFIDTRPNVPAGERYKAIAGIHESGITGYVSPDGLRWKKIRPEPILTSKAFAFDSQNVAFWSASEGKYIMYFRTWRGFESWGTNAGVRWVSRCTSDDFLNWSEPVSMDAGDTPPEHLYTQQTHPYYRAPHIYISLGARFWPGKRVLTDAQAAEINVSPGYYNDIADGVLMSSRGGNVYDRTFMESFIRPGPGLINWVSRTNYPALGVIPTGAGEMSLYFHRNYAQPTCYAGRLTLRTDGFASVRAPYAGGSMRTKALSFSGRELVLNAATSAAGDIRVEVQDVNGVPIPGFTLNDATPVVGDRIEHVVSWKNGTDVSALAGKPIRLWFVMKDADLFSMRFR